MSDYFVPTVLEVAECFGFNCVVERDGETMVSYVSRHREAAPKCNYGAFSICLCAINLYQMQRGPNRGQHLLDVFCCIKRSLVKACISIPGVAYLTFTSSDILDHQIYITIILF